MNLTADGLHGIGMRRAVQAAYENLPGKGVHQTQTVPVELSVPGGRDKAL